MSIAPCVSSEKGMTSGLPRIAVEIRMTFDVVARTMTRTVAAGERPSSRTDSLRHRHRALPTAADVGDLGTTAHLPREHPARCGSWMLAR